MDSIITDIICELKAAKNGGEIIKILLSFKDKNTEIKPNIKAGLFLYRNYYLRPAVFEAYPSYIDNLRYLEEKGYCPTAAYKFVGIPISQDGKSCVIITKINNSMGGDLSPYRFSACDELKVRTFADELIKLLEETSLYNPAIFDDSYRCWFLTPEKNIVFDDWGELLKCNSTNEMHSVKNNIYKMCGLKR